MFDKLINQCLLLLRPDDAPPSVRPELVEGFAPIHISTTQQAHGSTRTGFKHHQAEAINKRKPRLLNSAFQAGVTLVELVVFIVIMGVALAGVLKVLEITSRNSADPLVRKQALSIAESLLLEIQQQSFTFCDPDDANALTAVNHAGCATQSQDTNPAGTGAIIGPFPNTESPYNNLNPFDNVADYGGFTMPNALCAGICNADSGAPLAGLNAYAATVTITRDGNALGLNNHEALRIDVTVTGPANTVVTLTGYRVRYAPNI